MKGMCGNGDLSVLADCHIGVGDLVIFVCFSIQHEDW